MTTTGNDERLVAAVDLIDQLSGRDLEFGQESGTQPATWWAAVRVAGRSIVTSRQADALTAVLDLANRIVSGGQCARCGRPTVLGPTALPGRCALVRRDDTYTRSCERRSAR